MSELVSRRCFVCKKELTHAFYEGRDDNLMSFECPPADAVCFSSPGNYGSAVFDNQYGNLEISICDDCLLKGKDDVLFFTKETEIVMKAKPWQPEED